MARPRPGHRRRPHRRDDARRASGNPGSGGGAEHGPAEDRRDRPPRWAILFAPSFAFVARRGETMAANLGLTGRAPAWPGRRLLPEPLGELSRYAPRVRSGLNRVAPRARHGRRCARGSPAVPADPPVPATHVRVIGKHFTDPERAFPSAAGAPEARGRLTVLTCELRNRRNPQRRTVERARDRAAPGAPHMVGLAAGHFPAARDLAHQLEHEHLPASGPHVTCRGPATTCKHSSPGGSLPPHR